MKRGSAAGVGTVFLVGAGPGDPELLTVRAHRLLSSANVLAHDELVPAELLALAPREAERIPVGRRAGGCRHHDGDIHPLVVARARAGLDVVRLKGGDPSIFGRVGEEAEALARAGVPFEIVPGISAALGAAASTAIPLTLRGVAASVTLVTAHGRGDLADDGVAKLAARVPREGTIVVYMGLGRLAETCRALVAAGRARRTPAAVVAHATLPDERVVEGTLGTLAARVAALTPPLTAPALLVVGEVVAHRAALVARSVTAGSIAC
jgi:uroporphyrin-III C-methyltransferase